MTGKFTIQIPEKYAISVPDINGTETNPYFHPLVDKYATNMLKRGWKLWNGNKQLYAEVMSLTVQEFLLIKQFEGTVQYFNPFIKVSELNINNPIPEGLPNRTFQNQVDTTIEIDPETGEEIQVPVYEDVIHTWRTWRDSAHPLGELVEENYYFMSATFGKTLNCDELMVIYGSVDAELVDNIPVTENNNEIL